MDEKMNLGFGKLSASREHLTDQKALQNSTRKLDETAVSLQTLLAQDVGRSTSEVSATSPKSV